MFPERKRVVMGGQRKEGEERRRNTKEQGAGLCKCPEKPVS